MLDYAQWREKCRKFDALMWERAERSASVLAWQNSQESATQAEVQEEYDTMRKVHEANGGHGTYAQYAERQRLRTGG